MKILLDENISGHTETALKSEGHDVLRPKRGADDQSIFSLAETEQAIIITRDRDFLNFAPSKHSGIIYIRIHPSIAEHITKAINRLVATIKGNVLSGNVLILTTTGYEIIK